MIPRHNYRFYEIEMVKFVDNNLEAWMYVSRCSFLASFEDANIDESWSGRSSAKNSQRGKLTAHHPTTKTLTKNHSPDIFFAFFLLLPHRPTPIIPDKLDGNRQHRNNHRNGVFQGSEERYRIVIFIPMEENIHRLA